MQIASACNDCACDKCKPFKEKNLVDTRLNNDNKCASTQPSNRHHHHRTFARSRPAKAKVRYTYGNHHRLDHTYAASISESSQSKTPEQPAKNPEPKEDKENAVPNGSTDSGDEVIVVDGDDIDLKSSWLRNLCLEYQPSKSAAQMLRGSDEGSKEKQPRFHFTGTNGTLKQYHRSRKVNKNKMELSSTFAGKGKGVKSVQEDKRRWIAAQALIELAQSK